MKNLILALILLLSAQLVFAEEIIIPPRDAKPVQQVSDIKNLNEYFEYLPNAVHNNWTPYKANKDYEVTVQFRILKNGDITRPVIVNSTNELANTSVLNAVKSGAPYKPLPASYPGNSVNTQVQLKYIK